MSTLTTPPPRTRPRSTCSASPVGSRPKLSSVETRELWRRFTCDGDRAARDRLVLGYAPLVHYVAGKMTSALPSHVERADLVSYGFGGLIGAIERFEPGRGTRFEGFALMRIKGAMIDELRAADWLPRSLRARAREIERASARLEHELGRIPAEAELAERVGVSVRELDEALGAISRSAFIALDATLSLVDTTEDHLTLLDTVADPGAEDPFTALDVADRRRRVMAAVARLPERERIVVALYYYEGLKLREIGEILGVVESRVSQLRTRAVLHLRGVIAEDELAA